MVFENCLASGNEIGHRKLKGKRAFALVHSTTADSLKYRNCAPIRKRNGVEIPSSQEGPLTRISEFYEMENIYQLIDAETIGRSAFVVVNHSGVVRDENGDFIKDLMPGNSKHIIYLQPMSTWHKYFLDYESKDLQDQAVNRRSKNSIEDTDEVYAYEG